MKRRKELEEALIIKEAVLLLWRVGLFPRRRVQSGRCFTLRRVRLGHLEMNETVLRSQAEIEPDRLKPLKSQPLWHQVGGRHGNSRLSVECILMRGGWRC